MRDETGRCTGIGAMMGGAGAVGVAVETGVEDPEGAADEGAAGAEPATDGGASCSTGTFVGVRATGVVFREGADVLAVAVAGGV